MKIHTSNFKNNLKSLGRQLDSIITYTNEEEEEITLHDELYEITYTYNANLLKSVMKELDVECSIDLPLGTVINYQLGIKGQNDLNYEYLDYGNYVVFKSEKQEDTNTYLLTCYDKVLYSMQDYESIGVTYPISLKNYLYSLCTKIGLTLKDASFQNENMMIPYELYLDTNGNDLGYTYRDVLDEIAEATGSIICINNDDELEVRYPTLCNDTINEEFFKNINVNFSEKYGEINAIVLSRSAESDNVYIRDEESIAENGLCEIKIVDNQIMNRNDRSDYLNGILAGVGGIYYYLNDFESTGVLYYDIGDLYNVQIGENTYQCMMLNDEINITSGLEEKIYTEMPKQSETDYSKGDKTDRKINQTYIMVDKQNQVIESVVNNVTEQNNKIARVTQTVDELNSKISDIADITVSQETNEAVLNFTDINQSEPIRIVIHPIGGVNITRLYPRDNLYPSDTTYPTHWRQIRFYRTYFEDGEEQHEYINYNMPDDLLFYDSDNYDEFILDYEAQQCQINKKVGYNADGTTYVLAEPYTVDYDYPQILLGDGDYEVTLRGYDTAYMFVRLMAQNIYTTQFATRAEVHSEITQTASEINLEVSKKVNDTEIISKINQSPEAVTIDANKINLNGKTINMTSDNIKIQSTNFNVTKNGNMTCNNATMNNASMNNINIRSGSIELQDNGDVSSAKLVLTGQNEHNYLHSGGTTVTNTYWDRVMFLNAIQLFFGIESEEAHNKYIDLRFDDDKPSNIRLELKYDEDDTTLLTAHGLWTTFIQAYYINNISLESEKKNFEKLQNGLDIIKNIDIYKYNLKKEQDTDKKHIGFVIGDKYKYDKSITSKENDGADIYSFVSVCCKAIQEQQEQIEQLQNEIKKMKGEM